MFLVLYLAWIIFNGALTVEIALIGLLVTAAVFWFVCKFMGYSIRTEFKIYRSVFFLVKYFFVLLKEIVKANLDVFPRIYTIEKEMEPVIVKFRVDLRSDWCRVLLANSITLTPGTLTVSLDENEYTVHCLDESLAEGLDDSVFVKMLQAFEEDWYGIDKAV